MLICGLVDFLRLGDWGIFASPTAQYVIEIQIPLFAIGAEGVEEGEVGGGGQVAGFGIFDLVDVAQDVGSPLPGQEGVTGVNLVFAQADLGPVGQLGLEAVGAEKLPDRRWR